MTIIDIYCTFQAQILEDVRFLSFIAGFNSTLRQGNVTHHEYIQVQKRNFRLLYTWILMYYIVSNSPN